ncbi:hypothetical protein L1987_65219 [Smallanthus sonchifolius]|uniref:Uncharacterized protein n=2 Tax=Smallanthus sonchifolius TaxID=185202 RepID=A0ACB9BTY4_9ASTR|nr:hypothetical protein L1987_65218 [Smallanthus sonchifolius]KAI3725431.1 hypothetical protein L1987_65219 [Smallanthus sonchifolius]
METSLPYNGDSTALRVNTNRKPPTVRSAGDASALIIHAMQSRSFISIPTLDCSSYDHYHYHLMQVAMYYQFIIVICVVPFCEIVVARQNLKNVNLTRGGFGCAYKAD